MQKKQKKLTIVQVLPALDSGGVERGTLEISKYLVSKKQRSIVISNGGRLKKQLALEGGEHINLPIGVKSLLTLRIIPELIRVLIKNKVDIVHIRSRFPAWICFIAIQFIKYEKRPSIVTTFHGPYSVNIYSSIMSKGDRVIAVSKMIQKYILKNYKINSKKITLNYRGVDSKDFKYLYKPKKTWMTDWNKKYPNLKNKVLLTLPGRITRWKGQIDFLYIIAKLIKEFPNVHGLIVGDVANNKSNFLTELKEKVCELEIKDNISFIGHRTDIKEIISVSKIVFSLSKEPEAFGRTTIESIKIGVPVIGYNHGGVGEQLREIFPKGLVVKGDIAKAINLSKKWIKKRPKVPKTDLFDLKTMQENTLRVYREVKNSNE
jgi:glycosyltransferase involved in cell wall biosynthesis